MNELASSSSAAAAIANDADYDMLEQMIAHRVAQSTGPFFATDANYPDRGQKQPASLFDFYLAGIPQERRQHYNCNNCRRFINHYGGLVVIDSHSGEQSSLLWGAWDPSGVPAIFSESVASLDTVVRHSKVVSPFVFDESIWGVPSNVGADGSKWSHLSCTAPPTHRSTLKTASQRMADYQIEFATIKHGLAETPEEATIQAIRVLEANVVNRSNVALDIAKWLLALQQSLNFSESGTRHKRRKDNLIWLAVAKAPAGWCHIRSNMLSTFLADIKQGLSFDEIKSRWDRKMNPLQYQRPQVVKDGNLDQANKIVAKLGSAGSLKRRFARIDEITAFWVPPRFSEPVSEDGEGAFSHLKQKKSSIKPVELPAVDIGWDKFLADVVPKAVNIDVYLTAGPQEFYGLVTAVDPGAPPILQWDGLENYLRNPVSWYVYDHGSVPGDWGLSSGWMPVSALALKPCFWQKPEQFKQQVGGILFVLQTAVDIRHERGGGFFPEQLRSEYHEIRGAMEAYAKDADIAGKEEGNANGIVLRSHSLRVRVHTGSGLEHYQLYYYR